jgi:hypothetical protein
MDIGLIVQRIGGNYYGRILNAVRKESMLSLQ